LTKVVYKAERVNRRRRDRPRTGWMDGRNREHPVRWSEKYEIRKIVYKRHNERDKDSEGHGVMA
jgi:IS5 family transposase